MTHNALIKAGLNSKILFLVDQGDPPSSVYAYTSNSIIKKTKRFLITILDTLPTWFYLKKKNQLFSPGLFGLTLRDTDFFEWAQVIHIHWANHGFIDMKEIKRWGKPVIWTMRDMWPFTGGCHHSFNCDKYKLNCGSCPVLGSDRKQDLSSLVLRKKIKYLSVLPIHWVAISNWMKTHASSSTVLKNKQISVIFSGIDCSVYKLNDKNKSRVFFNLPTDKKIILIGAGNIRDEYKGFQYVLKSLYKIEKDYLIVTFGAGKIFEKEIPQKYINLGYIGDEKKLAKLYNSADVFLAPSIAEAFGKTFAEAQACGLPVICFDETGPADIIEHVKTGYLAVFKDQNDLLKGIKFCLNASFNRAYISHRAKNLFNIQQIIKQYVSLYQKCIH